MAHPKLAERPQCSEDLPPRCNTCGRFIGMKDLAEERARGELSMSMDGLSGEIHEEFLTYCRRCV